MTAYRVNRAIAATPEVIWGLLSDATSYPDWNPAVLGIEGVIRDGETIRLISIINPDRQFKLQVSDVRPPNHMRWSDGMPLGLFRGTRTFDVTGQADGTSVFEMEEVYSGPLAPMITKTIPDMTDSFEKFADGLKTAAESK